MGEIRKLIMICDICPNYCNLSDGRKTICHQDPIYDNENKIYTSKTTVEHIEESTLYHFMPGSKAFCVGLVGCNMQCSYCSYYTVAQPENELLIPTKGYTPDEIVEIAIHNDADVIIWKFTEPTIHPKWIINTSRIAKRYDLKTAIVSNGFTSPETLEKIAPYVDGVCIDLKSMQDSFYDEVCGGYIEAILNSIKYYLKHDIHIEIRNMIIPGYNDSPENFKELINYIKSTEKKIPLHFMRFNPAYKLKELEKTSEKKIMYATDLAAYMGLNYVYPDIEVAPKHKNNTYCKNCKHLLIKRSSDYTIESHVTDQCACENCNHIADVVQKTNDY